MMAVSLFPATDHAHFCQLLVALLCKYFLLLKLYNYGIQKTKSIELLSFFVQKDDNCIVPASNSAIINLLYSWLIF